MPDSEVLTLSDPYEHQGLLRNADVRVIVTSPGDYKAQLTRIKLDRLWIQRGRDALPRLFHTAVKTNRIIGFFLADEEQAPFFHSREELLADQIMLYAPETEHHQYSTAACHWGTMSLTPDDLAAAGIAIAGREVIAPTMTQRIRAPAPMVAQVRAFHAAAGNLAATIPDVLALPQVARAIEEELIRAIVRCLTVGQASGERAPGHTRLPVMRRFEQAVNEAEGSPLYLTELCAAIGVSERTLRLHCLEHIGMAPHRYLVLRRMNLVRQALTRANPAVTTVTTIAADHGFWEFGRFAVAYRKLFGEPPSVTLRRMP